MADSIRVVATSAEVQIDLLARAPPNLEAKSGPTEHGFGETLYPVLLMAGVATLPVGVLSGMIANWIGDVIKARKSVEPESIGLEAGDNIETFTLSDTDVDRIAERVVALLSTDPTDDRPG